MSDTIDELVDDPVLRLRLQRHLERSAEGVEIRRSPVTAVVRRADMRRRRQRAAAALGAACLVIVAVGAAVVGRSDDRTIVNVDEPPTPSTDSLLPSSTIVAPSTTAGETATPTSSASPSDDTLAPTTTPVPIEPVTGGGLMWERRFVDRLASTVFAGSASPVFNEATSITWIDSELSSSAPSQIYLSDDGVSWRRAPSTGTRVLGVAREPGAFHVVGVRLDAVEGDLLVESSSLDGGSTWVDRTIPFSDHTRQMAEILQALTGVSVAASRGTVVVGLNPNDDVTRRARSLVFAAEPGKEFVPVQLPDNRFTRVTASGDGFLAVSASSTTLDTSTLWRSDDGFAWGELGVLPFQQGQVGLVSGVYIAVAADNSERMFSTSTDGFTWATTDLNALLGDGGAPWRLLPYSGVFGQGSVTMLASRVGEAPRLSITRNGVTMVFDAGLQSIEFYEDDGVTLIGTSTANGTQGPIRLDGGPTLTVLDENGGIRAQFSLADATAAINAGAPSIATGELIVMRTDDLVTWSATAITSLVGDGLAYLDGAGAVGDVIVFRGPTAATDANGVPISQVIVGTPVP